MFLQPAKGDITNKEETNMKIRTDFVTNSSSSSFITITFEMKDGTMLTNQSEIENVGKMGVLVYMPDEEIINRIKNANSDDELYKVLDDLYHGAFTSGYYFEGSLGISSFDDVRKITIEDNWKSFDYGGVERVAFTYDPASKTGCSEQIVVGEEVSLERMGELFRALKEQVIKKYEVDYSSDEFEELAYWERRYNEGEDCHTPTDHPLLWLLDWLWRKKRITTETVLTELGATEGESANIEDTLNNRLYD